MHFAFPLTEDTIDDDFFYFSVCYWKQYTKNETKQKKKKKTSKSNFSRFLFLYDSISVLKPVGLTFIADDFNEYFPPNQLFQNTPVAVESFPRK